MKWSLCLALTIINLSILGVFIYAWVFSDPIEFDGLTVADLATILFVSATLVLTAVAILIAVLAVWGYNALQRTARQVAKDEAQRVSKPIAEETAEFVAKRTAEPVAYRAAQEFFRDAPSSEEQADAFWKGEDDGSN